ncbi:hypothetical protein BDN67DRAFT_607442 [Paxillus ammoniavirescens]|nr:hypothetical protein BDN67DRAFT_607442 [Paxillus ammoniavirescens]
MASTIDIDALPRPGTQFFLASLLGHVRAAAPGLPMEPVIIQVLLLCIISGDRNLILRTRDEDVGLVTKLTSLALNAVFGYNVHKLKCHSDTRNQTPSDFLRSLFFPPSATTLSTDGPNATSHKHKERHRRVSSSRNLGGKLPAVAVPSISTAHSRGTSFSRSVSYQAESKPSITTLRRSQLDTEGDGIVIGPKPAVNTETHWRRPGPPFGVPTEPSLPTLASSVSHHRHVSYPSVETLRLPSAVVVSGLEQANLPAQKAVLQTLAERKLILSEEGTFGHGRDSLVLELPEDFLMVYVCRSDPRERPPIYQSLLDRFAMSSPVNVSAQTRLTMRQYRPPSSPSTTLSSPHNSTTSAAFLHGPPTPPPQPPAFPVIPTALLRQLKDLCATQARVRAPLNIYLADLFTATRHYGSLDAMMLTTRARQDAETLVRATRVLGIDRTGAELIKEAANDAPKPSEVDSSSTERSYPHSHPSTASISSDALLDGADVPEIYEFSSRPSIHRSSASHLTGAEEPLELDVSEADIARIFPRVVSHRVRVRDTPFDEVLSSAVCGAVGRLREAESIWERDTVKDILVHILAEV